MLFFQLLVEPLESYYCISMRLILSILEKFLCPSAYYHSYIILIKIIPSEKKYYLGIYINIDNNRDVFNFKQRFCRF